MLRPASKFLFAVCACVALTLTYQPAVPSQALKADRSGGSAPKMIPGDGRGRPPLRVVSVHTGDELRAALRAARPGTRIELAPGEYPGGYWCDKISGEAGRPIVIAGADTRHPPVIKGGGVGFHFVAVSHLELRDLNIEGIAGDGLMMDDGGVRERPMQDVLVQNVRIADIGPKGNFHGIKMAGVDNFRIENCRFEGWGAGYGLAIDGVGCHRGTLEGNLFQDRAERTARGFGAIQFKGGSRDIVIRRNRFERTGLRAINIGGSTGREYFRPTLEAWPAGEGRYEAKNIRVEGNTFVGSVAPVAFVNVDGATVRFNTFYLPEQWALRILQETQYPGFVPSRGGVFTDNIIVFDKKQWFEGGVNIGPGAAPATFTFARNFWLCADAPAHSRPTLPVTETEGVYGVNPLFRDAAAGDFRLRPNSPARKMGAEALPR